MADGFCDTGFGALMRALSKNKLFQYPDEKDGSISRRFEARPVSAAQDEDGDASSGKTETGGDGDGPLRPLSVHDVVEANNQATIRIVEWYDDNDPEVRDWPFDACAIQLAISTRMSLDVDLG